MHLSTWNRRFAVAGCCAVVGLTSLAPIASAETTSNTPQPPVAPITLSPQESQQLCDVTVPRLEQRADKLTQIVNGGPDVKGSVKWLQQRAQDARDHGHQVIANRLDQRAQRRAERVQDLASVQQRLESFKAQHCKPAGDAQ